MSIEGGLEEIRIVSVDAGRLSVRIGNTRVMDIVPTGNDLIAEYKPGKKKQMKTNLQDLITQLIQKLEGLKPTA